MCGTPNPSLKDYKRICSECTFENDGTLMFCEMCNTPNTFYIYTSEICDWAQNIDNFSFGYSVINMWITKLCENILDLIPDNFKVKVKIEHYDPLYEVIKKDGSKCTKREVLSKPGVSILIDSLLSTDKSRDKVSDSTFMAEELPFTQFKKPHILLDFAHLFEYPSKNTIKWMNSYMSCRYKRYKKRRCRFRGCRKRRNI